MSSRSRRLILALPITFVILCVFGVIGWPLIEIQFRLWRNGAIGTELVESLHERFPGAKFRATASYQREVVYIRVLGGLHPESRPDVEKMLLKLKAEESIAPSIWLLWPEFTGEEKDAIKF
jgi:hypothetical protein